MTTNTNPTSRQRVDEAARTLRIYQGRTGADWARDGYSLHMAQAAVDAAHADYMKAFMEYAEATCG